MPNMKSTSYGSIVIANVKVDNRKTKQTDKQTGQKQYAPDHSILGHNKKQNKPYSKIAESQMPLH